MNISCCINCPKCEGAFQGFSVALWLCLLLVRQKANMNAIGEGVEVGGGGEGGGSKATASEMHESNE